MSESTPTTPPPSARERPFWRRGLLGLAITTTLGGTALWIYALVTAPKAGTGVAGVAGLTEGGGGAAVVDERLIAAAGPAVARFGGSFIVGYCLGFAFRKFLKLTALLVGVAVVGAYALHRFQIVDLSPDQITDHVQRGLEWARGEAGQFKAFLLGYVPSGFAAAVGGFFGFRRS